MKHIETIVSTIQTNKPINAIKTGIIKVANINIGVAALIFLFAIFKVQTNLIYVTLYQLYCVTIALFMSIIITRELSDQEHFQVANALIIALLSIHFINSPLISVYPIVACVIAVITVYFLEMVAKIKLKSDKVPTAVTDYLNNTMPIVFILILSTLIVLFFPRLFMLIGQGIIFITSMVASVQFVLLVIIAVCLFWILGIHGVGVIGTIVRPFWFYMMILNGYLIIQNQPAHYIGTEAFLQWAVWIGGSGCTIGLSILLRTMSKTTSLKELGKDAFMPNIFNINENIIFGVPIVDNKKFIIPFFLAPIVCALVGYFAFATGLVNTPSIVAPWVLPAPIGIFISTLADVRSILLVFVLIGVSALVYFPFFVSYDRELYKAEQDLK